MKHSNAISAIILAGLFSLAFSAYASGTSQAAVPNAPIPTVSPTDKPESTDGFTAWVISDIHYLADCLHDDGALYTRLIEGGDNKNIAMTEALLDALTWTALSPASCAAKPDCLIVTGDLTFNGEKASHLALARRFKSFADAGVPVYVLPGNHDIDNPMAKSYQADRAEETATVDPSEFARIFGPYGFNEAVSRDRDSLSYVVEPRPGIRLLLLDSTYTQDNLEQGYAEAGGWLGESTRDWIGDCVRQAEAAGARLVVAMHHSLIDHNTVINDQYTIEDSDTLVSFFSELGIGYVLTGHTHIQDIARAAGPEGPIYDITTNALSVYPHCYGQLRLTGEAGPTDIEYATCRVDVASWALATGASDSRLVNFYEYARRYFCDHSSRMMARILDSECGWTAADTDAPTLSTDQRGQLIDLLVTINERFFSGTEDRNKEDVLNSANMALLDLLPTGFLKDYALSILNDQMPGDNELHLPPRTVAYGTHTDGGVRE